MHTKLSFIFNSFHRNASEFLSLRSLAATWKQRRSVYLCDTAHEVKNLGTTNQI
jgi:hypothetical protein